MGASTTVSNNADANRVWRKSALPSPLQEVHLDERQVAERLGVSTKWLQKMRYVGGGIPYRKFGRVVRYSLSAIMDFEEQAERSSTSEI